MTRKFLLALLALAMASCTKNVAVGHVEYEVFYGSRIDTIVCDFTLKYGGCKVADEDLYICQDSNRGTNHIIVRSRTDSQFFIRGTAHSCSTTAPIHIISYSIKNQ